MSDTPDAMTSLATPGHTGFSFAANLDWKRARSRAQKRKKIGRRRISAAMERRWGLDPSFENRGSRADLRPQAPHVRSCQAAIRREVCADATASPGGLMQKSRRDILKLL